MTHLRAAYKRLLPAEVEFTADVRLVGAVTSPDGRLVELRTPARASTGERLLLAAVHENGLVENAAVAFHGPDGLLLELRSEPTGDKPVFLLGECVPRADGWWFVELGYGLPNGAALANLLRATGADRAALTALVTLPRPEPTRPRMLPGTRLADARLEGARTGGPVRLDVAVDLSGSMAGYSAVRQEALAELITFAKTQLAEDDVISVIAFAGEAAPITPPVEVRKLKQTGENPRHSIGGGTNFIPVLQLLQRYSAPKGMPRSMIVITDAYIFDDRRELARQLKRAAYDHIYFVVPQPDPRRIPIAREPWFADVALRNLSDAAQLALTYGEVFATLTGQRLRPAKQ
jgi:hypothetical protein